MQSQNARNTLSRRNWLRNATIGATSAVVLPSLLTGCADHLNPEPGGLGAEPPLTQAELISASHNLFLMEVFANNLYDTNVKSIQGIYKLLKGDPLTPPTNFVELFIDVFSEITSGILEAALEAIPGIGAAIAIAAEGINVWADEERKRARISPNGLNTTIGTFELNYQNVHKKIKDKLGDLRTSDNNYHNLRENWKDVEFLGKTYSAKQLANANFPSNADQSPTVQQFNALLDAANGKFVKYFWNAVIVQCGVLRSSYPFTGINPNKPGGAVGYARDVIYKTEDQIPTYTTGHYGLVDTVGTGYFEFTNWYFTFDDGVPLSQAVAEILFKDDTPGHSINTNGLWPRDYVFKQFHREKPEWPRFERDLGTEAVSHRNPADDFGRLLSDYEFTGGMLKSLSKPQ